MNQIATVLTAGPMTWQQIQAALEQNFEWVHGAVLVGLLNAMIKRKLIVQDGDHYALMD
jgi:predicted 2-oxoglutarate/Fe(II)-dependent dioxygenase YbiX